MSPFKFTRFSQETEDTCGPAVIRMLLDFYHINVTESQVVEATQAKDMIKDTGTRLDQLATSIKNLAPEYTIWYKEDAHINEVSTLIHEYKVPVVVDWQGLFWDSLLEEMKLSTHPYHGHYAIVTDIDIENDKITIADPYHEFSTQDRIFPLDWFKTRWWDVADTEGTEIKDDVSYYTSRMMFILIPKSETFPLDLGMQTVAEDYFEKKIEKARKSQAFHPSFEPSQRKLAVMKFLSSINQKIASKIR